MHLHLAHKHRRPASSSLPLSGPQERLYVPVLDHGYSHFPIRGFAADLRLVPFLDVVAL